MPLASGAKLGPYEILAPIGAGGMGEVYRARDTRLDRTVAIKMLSASVKTNPNLKERFEREARVISQLQHPNICTLFDVGHSDGVDFLVMEFLEGESLADRLQRGPLPLKQTLEIGVQIAEALDRAHRAGITHRDLKPGNVMLTKGGAKLLDFGLAKPAPTLAAAASSAATVSKPLTSEGTLVGTFQYMAPEQLQGQEADSRSDIFALGAVLYEMLTGRRAFDGKSQISVMSAILERDPEPISAAQPLTPPVLEHAVRRALEKYPDRRWQSAADLASELKWIAESPSSAMLPMPALSSHRMRRRAISIAALVAVLAIGIVIGLLSRPQPAQHPLHTVILPPEKNTLALVGDFAGPPVLSPDGQYIVFTAADTESHSLLWLRPLNSLEAHPLPGTEGAIFPFWSPDSRFIAFFADGKLKTTDLHGGAPLAIADAGAARGGSWGINGDIIFTADTQAPIVRVSANGGGATVAITKIDPNLHTTHRWPFMLPDGKHFLYSAINHDSAKSANDGVYYASLNGKENRLLGKSLSNAIYADGYLLFARETQLMAEPFDPATGKLSGEPQRLADGVENDLSTWHMDASVSSNGLLAMGTGGSADLEMFWVDRAGKPLGMATDQLGSLQTARLSPQGDRLAMQIDAGVNDLWISDLVRRVRTRLTFGENVYSGNPAWSPDGKYIAYASAGGDGRKTTIMRRPSDGSGAPEQLLDSGHPDFPTDWSHDGKYILFDRADSVIGGVGHEQVWALPLVGERKPVFLVATGTTAYPRRHSLSPNGHWLAYSSNESGQEQIFVIPFLGGQGKWQISPAGGTEPFWSSDSKELFYLGTGNKLESVAITEKAGSIQFGLPQTLFVNSNAQNPFFDAAPGAKKFILNRIVQQTNQPITLISNWPAELKK
jgi:eukaryotic-like serine/threonine-protein kinase